MVWVAQVVLVVVAVGQRQRRLVEDGIYLPRLGEVALFLAVSTGIVLVCV